MILCHLNNIDLVYLYLLSCCTSGVSFCAVFLRAYSSYASIIFFVDTIFWRKVIFIYKTYCGTVKYVISFIFVARYTLTQNQWWLIAVRSQDFCVWLFQSDIICVIQIMCPGKGEGKVCVNIYEDINKCICSWKTCLTSYRPW